MVLLKCPFNNFECYLLKLFSPMQEQDLLFMDFPDTEASVEDGVEYNKVGPSWMSVPPLCIYFNFVNFATLATFCHFF